MVTESACSSPRSHIGDSPDNSTARFLAITDKIREPANRGTLRRPDCVGADVLVKNSNLYPPRKLRAALVVKTTRELGWISRVRLGPIGAVLPACTDIQQQEFERPAGRPRAIL